MICLWCGALLCDYEPTFYIDEKSIKGCAACPGYRELWYRLNKWGL